MATVKVSDDNVISYPMKQNTLLSLLVDNETDVTIGDKPIFGISVTIDQKLLENKNRLLSSGTIIGWVNYIGINKFACVTIDNHYVDPSDYFIIEENTIKLARPAIILSIDADMSKSKHLFELKFD
ncbi:hypothetical protein [Glaciecola sp. 1036]|uniref:hypothetical protein n=1 Tax=Alteromonadaceae TaxID=72275 RepID=UPI003CFC707F